MLGLGTRGAGPIRPRYVTSLRTRSPVDASSRLNMCHTSPLVSVFLVPGPRLGARIDTGTAWHAAQIRLTFRPRAGGSSVIRSKGSEETPTLVITSGDVGSSISRSRTVKGNSPIQDASHSIKRAGVRPVALEKQCSVPLEFNVVRSHGDAVPCFGPISGLSVSG